MLLARIIIKMRILTHITNIKNELEDITTNPKDRKKIIKDYYEQLYAPNLITGIKSNNSLKDTLAKLTQEKINKGLYEIESMNNLPNWKATYSGGFTSEFHQ